MNLICHPCTRNFHRWAIGVCIVVAAISPQPGRAEGRRVAFLVGVNEYLKPGLKPLRFAEADVEAVTAELKNFGFETTLLTGTQATNRRINETVVELTASLTRNDTVLVMLAGHGQQLRVEKSPGEWIDEAFFCPVDGVKDQPESLCSISNMIDKHLCANAGQRMVLIDACRNKPFDGGRGVQGQVISLPEETAVLFSCRAGQESFEREELQHGIFTYALLDALRGGAAREGKIVWSAVVSYVDWMMAGELLRGHMPVTSPQVPVSAGGVSYAVIGQGNWKKEKIPKGKATPNPVPITSSVINSIGMKLVRVPPSTFEMGSPVSEPGRRRGEVQHAVSIESEFYVGVCEVSQSEYRLVMNVSPSYFNERGVGGEFLENRLSEQLPVEQVSWIEANEFCKRLSELPAEKAARRRYRLPTEAEWELACRGGTRSAFFFGEAFSDRLANGDARFLINGTATIETASPNGAGFLGSTVDVAMYQRNSLGLYGTSGNVSEWCADFFDASFYSQSPTVNPVGPASGQTRVVRGGSWFDAPSDLRSAARGSADPAERSPFIGFRVVMESL